MSAHEALGGGILTLLALALSVFLLFLFIVFVRRQLGRLGLKPGEVALILWATFLGGFVSIPLAPFGSGFIGINLGGGLLPIFLSFYLIRRKQIPGNEVFVGIVVVATIAYLVTDYVPGQGVLSPFPLWLLPALGAFVVSAFAFWHDREDSAALAYVVGTLGVLLGADVARLPEILAGPTPDEGILAIGGGAVFDMVYLTGVLAVAMEASVLTKRRHDLSRAGYTNRIEREYQAWVASKQVPGRARGAVAPNRPPATRDRAAHGHAPAPVWRTVDRPGR